MPRFFFEGKQALASLRFGVSGVPTSTVLFSSPPPFFGLDAKLPPPQPLHHILTFVHALHTHTYRSVLPFGLFPPRHPSASEKEMHWRRFTGQIKILYNDPVANPVNNPRREGGKVTPVARRADLIKTETY
jgi:hypothetical protein